MYDLQEITTYRVLCCLIPDKTSAIQFFRQNRILHANRLCDHNHEMKLCLTDKRDDWRCRKGRCDQTIGLRTGRWLSDFKTNLDSILHFIYWWAQEKTSIKFCKGELSLDKETTIRLNLMLRVVCAQDLLENPIKIGMAFF